jgi:outer membrane protein
MAIISCFFTFVVISYGADVAKIGIIDFQRVLTSSKVGKSAQEEINRKGKKMEADLKVKGAEIEELKKRLERESLVMSKAQRDEKEREFRIKINDLKSLRKKYTEEFKVFEAELVQKIQKDLFELVSEIGKREGYLLIMEKREGGILYSPNAIDITDKLIKRYNARAGKMRLN